MTVGAAAALTAGAASAAEAPEELSTASPARLVAGSGVCVVFSGGVFPVGSAVAESLAGMSALVAESSAVAGESFRFSVAGSSGGGRPGADGADAVRAVDAGCSARALRSVAGPMAASFESSGGRLEDGVLPATGASKKEPDKYSGSDTSTGAAVTSGVTGTEAAAGEDGSGPLAGAILTPFFPGEFFRPALLVPSGGGAVAADNSVGGESLSVRRGTRLGVL